MSCESTRKDFALYLYGELSFNEEEALEQHLDSCPDCSAALDQERTLFQALDLEQQEPSAELLHACRREFKSRIAPAVERKAQPAWRRLLDSITSLIPPSRVLRPAGALALLVMGFAGGKAWNSSVASEPSLVRVRDLSTAAGGAVHLQLEEVRHRTMSGPIDDARIQRMLLAAAADPSDPGLRARTLDILKDRCERADVRKALLQALRTDTNAGVRLKAIEGLQPFAGEVDTRKVLAGILLTDDNPGVRTKAIDLLVANMNAENIGLLQELIIRDQNPYIRQKSATALRQMNASVETF